MAIKPSQSPSVRRNGRNSEHDVYQFIRDVIKIAKTKEVFTHIHMKSIDKDLYLAEMDEIIRKKLTMDEIAIRMFRYDELIFREKTKKNPSLLRLKKYTSIITAYEDTVQYISSFYSMKAMTILEPAINDYLSKGMADE